MNWDAISAIGEIVGAVAVIATLLYLAKEIRQNSVSVAISALRDTTAQWNQWSEMIATSPDLADIVVKGNHSHQNLSDSESLRYGAYVQSFFDNVESYRLLVNKHQVDNDLQVLESIVRRRIDNSGFSDWWSNNTVDYSNDFVEWIEGIRSDS